MACSFAFKLYNRYVDSSTERKGKNLITLPHLIDKVINEKVVNMNTYVCQNCGKEFTTKKDEQKYCSLKCYWEKRKKESELTGKRFGRWTVLEQIETRGKYGKVFYLCKCDCGTIKEVPGRNLLDGSSKSCGCLHKEIVTITSSIHHKKHGEVHNRLYTVWNGIKRRCLNPSTNNFKRYGGRGITICDEWKDYENFSKWAYANGYDIDAPFGECTIDRIDVDGNYEPSNCRWVNKKVQANNTRTNKYITYKGETHTSAEWARIFNISYSCMQHRLQRGWEMERIENCTK